jgi:hypothetical protein
VDTVWFFEVFGFWFFEMPAQVDQDLVSCFFQRQQLNAGLETHGVELPTLHLAQALHRPLELLLLKVFLRNLWSLLPQGLLKGAGVNRDGHFLTVEISGTKSREMCV